MTRPSETRAIIILIVLWFIIGFILFNVIADRNSRRQANEHEKQGKIEQNIPSPPKSMVSYRVSKGD